MDVATIANFLMFLGAFGVSFGLDSDDNSSGGSSSDPDSLYNSADYSRTDRLGDEDDDIAADGDNLAWFTGGGDDKLSGSSGADYADLGSGNDSADMGAGNDIVEAGDGDDQVAGGNGNDLALGGTGNDSLDGGTGDDRLGGDTGDDLLTGGSGNDILAGGEGNDVISGFSSLGGGTASMNAPDGIDQLFGGTGDDHLILGRGDIATGGAGNDTFELDARWHDGTGVFTISDFQRGEDSLVLHYTPSTDPDSSDPLTPELTIRASADGLSSLIVVNGAIVGVAEGVTDLQLSDITLLADTETDPGYRPENFDSILPGGDGDDDATGTEGDDYGRFGAGDDTAEGAAGTDSLRGEEGEDSLSGGDDADTLFGGDGNDILTGDAGNDVVSGDHGDDLALGGDGADRVFGGGGDDTISGAGEIGAGGTATAIDGADSLYGGDGDDTLILGRGDLGLGGDGADTFWLDASSNADAVAFATVQDYDDATDTIELHYTPVYNASGVEIPPTISILRGPSDAYGVIAFNGDPIAHVIGAADLTLADLTLVRDA